MARSIVLIGGGGHCASCIEAIESTDEWQIEGIVDLPERRGESIFGYEVIGSDEDLSALAIRYAFAVITIGQIESSSIRRRLFTAAISAGFILPVIVASTARISRYARIDSGTLILHNVFINARASVGQNCIVNTGAIIEHDAGIGSHSHISTGALINGGCEVGEDCFIGSGAVLKNDIRLTNGVVLGAGAIAIHDILNPGVYAGCPVRKIG